MKRRTFLAAMAGAGAVAVTGGLALAEENSDFRSTTFVVPVTGMYHLFSPVPVQLVTPTHRYLNIRVLQDLLWAGWEVQASAPMAVRLIW